MYEEFIILGVSGIVSLLIILYSNLSVDRHLKDLVTIKYVPESSTMGGPGGFITRKRELEYLKDILQTTIARIYKEFEDGKITESERDLLVSKFRSRLLEVERELSEVSLYAELEELELEYKRLIDDFERRKRELEERIGRLKGRLPTIEEAVEKEAPKKVVEKAKKPVKRREEDLSTLMKELADMMKKLEEGEE
jgi:valyl-tRNA synthetase